MLTVMATKCEHQETTVARPQLANALFSDKNCLDPSFSFVVWNPLFFFFLLLLLLLFGPDCVGVFGCALPRVCLKSSEDILPGATSSWRDREARVVMPKSSSRSRLSSSSSFFSPFFSPLLQLESPSPSSLLLHASFLRKSAAIVIVINVIPTPNTTSSLHVGWAKERTTEGGRAASAAATIIMNRKEVTRASSLLRRHRDGGNNGWEGHRWKASRLSRRLGLRGLPSSSVAMVTAGQTPLTYVDEASLVGHWVFHTHPAVSKRGTDRRSRRTDGQKQQQRNTDNAAAFFFSSSTKGSESSWLHRSLSSLSPSPQVVCVADRTRRRLRWLLLRAQSFYQERRRRRRRKSAQRRMTGESDYQDDAESRTCPFPQPGFGEGVLEQQNFHPFDLISTKKLSTAANVKEGGVLSKERKEGDNNDSNDDDKRTKEAHRASSMSPDDIFAVVEQRLRVSLRRDKLATLGSWGSIGVWGFRRSVASGNLQVELYVRDKVAEEEWRLRTAKKRQRVRESSGSGRRTTRREKTQQQQKEKKKNREDAVVVVVAAAAEAGKEEEETAGPTPNGSSEEQGEERRVLADSAHRRSHQLRKQKSSARAVRQRHANLKTTTTTTETEGKKFLSQKSAQRREEETQMEKTERSDPFGFCSRLLRSLISSSSSAWPSSSSSEESEPRPVLIIFDVPVRAVGGTGSAAAAASSSNSYPAETVLKFQEGKIWALRYPYLPWSRTLIGSFEVHAKKQKVALEPLLQQC